MVFVGLFTCWVRRSFLRSSSRAVEFGSTQSSRCRFRSQGRMELSMRGATKSAKVFKVDTWYRWPVDEGLTQGEGGCDVKLERQVFHVASGYVRGGAAHMASWKMMATPPPGLCWRSCLAVLCVVV